MFSKAIVRVPGANYADGITAAGLGVPDLEVALKQHRAYCDALVECGLTLIELEADVAFPDSTFVEDTAVLTDANAVITQPGAESRRGEIARIAEALSKQYAQLDRIEPPGTLDGGDVCQIEDHFVIGISDRTNEDGARQLAEYMSAAGFTASFIDIRGMDGLLHLKSGLSYLCDGRVLVVDALRQEKAFAELEVICVPADETYAANCIRVNDFVLTPAGFPKTHRILTDLGYNLKTVEMSEFQKMDGGLSCLSLRF